MFAVVRRYQFDPNKKAEIDKKVKDSFVPLIKKSPGFVAYYWLSNDEGRGCSMSVFQDKAGAEQSVKAAADYVAKNLAGLLHKPDVTMGPVTAHS
jgi:hypothetical protein